MSASPQSILITTRRGLYLLFILERRQRTPVARKRQHSLAAPIYFTCVTCFHLHLPLHIHVHSEPAFRVPPVVMVAAYTVRLFNLYKHLHERVTLMSKDESATVILDVKQLLMNGTLELNASIPTYKRTTYLGLFEVYLIC